MQKSRKIEPTPEVLKMIYTPVRSSGESRNPLTRKELKEDRKLIEKGHLPKYGSCAAKLEYKNGPIKQREYWVERMDPEVPIEALWVRETFKK